jgi:predicted O-methyltransferase YrrM
LLGENRSCRDAVKGGFEPALIDPFVRQWAGGQVSSPVRRRAASYAHDQACSNRLQRFRNIEPPTAELLGVLIRASGSQQILELGTSNGYSTIWLGDAAAATGGAVLSIDIDAARTELAVNHLRDVHLKDHVKFQTEDAKLTLARSSDSQWDFIFLDAERPAYPGYMPDLLRTLAPAGVLAVDNVHSHQHELVQFTSLIEAEHLLTQTVVDVGAGLRLAVRDR